MQSRHRIHARLIIRPGDMLVIVAQGSAREEVVKLCRANG